MPRCVGRDTRTGVPMAVSWANGRIERVESLADGESVDDDLYLAPGLIDLQINGHGGVNFGDPQLTVAKTLEVACSLWKLGVTHFLPTLITNAVDDMAAALRRLAAAAGDPRLSHSILGFHLEGPYLSSEDGPRGAHPLAHCKDPDWDEFRRLQDAADGKIRLVTLAPERTGAIGFIERAVAAGVRVAIGHTAASRQQILDAVSAGASMSTHLGNAAHDRLQRHHNYIFDQLGDDRLCASLIVDGHHLPPHLVRIFARAKTLDRIFLVSDAVQYAGLPPGVHDAGYRKFEVRDDGFIGVVGEPRLAGSGLMLLRGVANFVRFADVSLADALRCASDLPAEYLGEGKRLGALLPGREASFTRLRWPRDGEPTVLETVVAGQRVEAMVD